MSMQTSIMVPSPRDVDRLGWAQRFARRLITPEGANSKSAAAQQLLAEERLRALFDAVYRQANDALEQVGSTTRISLTGSPHLRLYSLQRPDGTERDLTVHIMVSAEYERLSGGAYIGSSVSPIGLYLAPVVENGEPRWQVEPAGIAFTEAIVHDLFLCIFADDVEAGARLAPFMQKDL